MRKIKKNDTVIVTAGKEIGKSGKVLRVIEAKQDTKRPRAEGSDRVLVEGLNIIKRHTKARGTQRQAGIVEKEGPMDISNVALVSPTTGKAVRVGFQTVTDAKGVEKKVRVVHKTGEVLDPV